MQDKRQNKRYSVEELDIRGQVLFNKEVRINDISLGGLSIKSDKQLRIGSEYTLKLGSNDDSVKVKARVLWEKITGFEKNVRGESAPVYTVGLQFKDTITDKGEGVEEFIRNAARDSSLRLSGVRVNLFEEGEKGVLFYPKHYSVKRISTGGMLVELGVKLPVGNELPMELSFPESAGHIKFAGRVTSCKRLPAKGPARYDVGIEFAEMDNNCRDELKELIELLETLSGNS